MGDRDAPGRFADAAAVTTAGESSRLQKQFARLYRTGNEGAGILEFATDLENPDFAKLAEAAGVLGLRAETPEQVRPMLLQALRHGTGRSHGHRQELSMPPTLTVEQMKGFSLYMIKAVLDGRGTKILDLAKTTCFDDVATNSTRANRGSLSSGIEGMAAPR